MRSRALWHIDEDTSILKDHDIEASLGVHVKTLFSSISLGTERLVSCKKVPLEMYDHMRVNYMEGNFNLPIKYGYSLAGQLDNGDRVHLMHPHQTEICVEEKDLYLLSDKLPSKRACLLSNMETCLNAIYDAQLHGDEAILIIGFGGIGALLATTLKEHFHANVEIKDINPYKTSVIEKLGHTLSTEKKTYNVIFNTSANYSMLQYAIDHTTKEGKVVELSWYGDATGSLKLGSNFHYNRVRIIGSQVSSISPFSPYKSYLERKKEAESVLKNDLFDQLITRVVQFEDLPAYFSELRKGVDDIVVLVDY